MDTRSGSKKSKPEGGYSEAELEILSVKLAEQQAQLQKQQSQLQEQSRALQMQREEFERERNESLQSISMERDRIREREAETRQTREAEEAFKTEIAREINRLRQEIDDARRAGPSRNLTALRELDDMRQEDPPRALLANRNQNQINQFEDPVGISPIPKVSFREATESVPVFDGYNISLSQFVRACRRAKEIVPAFSERNLTKLLINKLRGRAYYAVEDEPCETITQLIDLLTTAFGSSKTVDQYRGELSTVYKKPTEHMLDYISRIKELRSAILDTERREKGTVSNSLLKEIDKLTAKSFRDGLPLEYRLQMPLDEIGRAHV